MQRIKEKPSPEDIKEDAERSLKHADDMYAPAPRVYRKYYAVRVFDLGEGKGPGRVVETGPQRSEWEKAYEDFITELHDRIESEYPMEFESKSEKGKESAIKQCA